LRIHIAVDQPNGRGKTPWAALHLFGLPVVTFGLVTSVVFFTGPVALRLSASSALSGAVTARLGAALMAIDSTGILVLTVQRPFDARLLVPLFLIYGIGRGLAQPALINAIVAGTGIAGSAGGVSDDCAVWRRSAIFFRPVGFGCSRGGLWERTWVGHWLLPDSPDRSIRACVDVSKVAEAAFTRVRR
jgi:hypothetical protein